MNIQLETNLKELNVGLTIEQLEHISFPFYLEEKWTGIKNVADRLEFENEQLQQEQVSLEKQRAFLRGQITEIKEEIGRASCRERVKIKEEAGEGEKKRKESRKKEQQT